MRGRAVLCRIEVFFSMDVRADQSDMGVQTKSLYCLLVLLILTSACSYREEAPDIWEHAQSGLYDAAYSDNARYVAVSTVDEGVYYWDLIQNRSLFHWRHTKNSDNRIQNIDFSPDGRRVITADKNSYVIWDTQTGRALGYWAVDADIRDVAISDMGDSVLIGLQDGRALHINQKTGRRLEVIAHGYEPVTAVALSADGRLAITGGDDSRIMVWGRDTGREVASFEHRSRVTLVLLDRQMKKVFSADTEAGAYIWSLHNGELITQLETKPREYVISTARFSMDGTQLVTGSPGTEVSIWDSRSGKRMNRWYVHTRGRWPPKGATVQAVAFTEDGRSVLATASNGFGQRWDWGLN